MPPPTSTKHTSRYKETSDSSYLWGNRVWEQVGNTCQRFEQPKCASVEKMLWLRDDRPVWVVCLWQCFLERGTGARLEDEMYHFNREKRSREDIDAISFTITPSRPTTDLVLNRRSSIECPLNSCMNKWLNEEDHGGREEEHRKGLEVSGQVSYMIS